MYRTLKRGTLGCLRNRKTEEKIIQNRKKMRPKPKTDTMVTSAAYRANYANTLFHENICECHGHSYLLVPAKIIGFISATLSSPDFVGSFSVKQLVIEPS